MLSVMTPRSLTFASGTPEAARDLAEYLRRWGVTDLAVLWSHPEWPLSGSNRNALHYLAGGRAQSLVETNLQGVPLNGVRVVWIAIAHLDSRTVVGTSERGYAFNDAMDGICESLADVLRQLGTDAVLVPATPAGAVA
jgi:hypothetical protein